MDRQAILTIPTVAGVFPETLQVSSEAIGLIPARVALASRIVPVRVEDDLLVIAAANAVSDDVLDDLRLLCGHWIDVVPAPVEWINTALREHYGVVGSTLEEMIRRDGGAAGSLPTEPEDEEDQARQASVIKLVNELLTDAIRQRASDLHIEPGAQQLAVRFRVDGIMRQQSVPAELHQFRMAICSRIKILAKLNIAEKRLPQDGGFRTTIDGREIDVRVSIIPMLHGEGIVLRLLESRGQLRGLADLEFPADVLANFRRLIRRPHGIVLVTGPTGSGKTSTLYSALAEMHRPDFKIITVEDPVEYRLPGVNQIQVQAKIGLTFAAGLRSILRHDPDVILLGEIRDPETAQSAMQASLTGHLVLSTLHTNDACSAMTRLIDMGIEPYLVASTLEGILAQRLVRRLCERCRVPTQLDDLQLPVDFPAAHSEIVWLPGGCEACHHSGYSGRSAVAELLTLDAPLRSLCVARADAGRIRQAARMNGMRSLRESGWEKVLAGRTSADEVLRVIADSEEVLPAVEETMAW